jgi:proteic killer suppression protein
MIQNFRHKGLHRFSAKNDDRGIPTQHTARIERLLDRLDAAIKLEDMDLPGYRFHPLKGDGRAEKLRIPEIGDRSSQWH